MTTAPVDPKQTNSRRPFHRVKKMVVGFAKLNRETSIKNKELRTKPSVFKKGSTKVWRKTQAKRDAPLTTQAKIVTSIVKKTTVHRQTGSISFDQKCAIVDAMLRKTQQMGVTSTTLEKTANAPQRIKRQRGASFDAKCVIVDAMLRKKLEGSTTVNQGKLSSTAKTMPRNAKRHRGSPSFEAKCGIVEGMLRAKLEDATTKSQGKLSATTDIPRNTKRQRRASFDQKCSNIDALLQKKMGAQEATLIALKTDTANPSPMGVEDLNLYKMMNKEGPMNDEAEIQMEQMIVLLEERATGETKAGRSLWQRLGSLGIPFFASRGDDETDFAHCW